MARIKEDLNEYEAAIAYGFSPELLRWLTKNPIIDNKLLNFTEKNGLYYFKIAGLQHIDQKMAGKWPIPPKGKRPTIPSGIKREIKKEARYRCPICNTNQGEAAHIKAVSKSYCNHPNNLLFLCPDHHTEYDYGVKPANVTIEDVRHFKESLQKFCKIQWQLKGKIIHTFVGALNTAVSLIEIQKQLKKIIPDDDFKVLLDSISKESVSVGGKEIKKASTKTLIEEISDNIHSESETVCPLCHGVGGTAIYDPCPVCYGNGEIDEKDIDAIDISRYQATECELCKGRGSRHGDACPACGGEGQVSKGFADEHDWSQYELIDCELCKGKGSRHGDDCPACGGEGQVSKGFADDHDWSQYD